MDIFKNVLISIDFNSDSEQAKIDRVLEMARRHKETALTLIYIAPEVSPDPETSIVSCKNQQQALLNHGEERLKTLATSFSDEVGLKNKINYLVKVGKPSAVLTEQVIAQKHDLLVVNTQNKTLKESLFGNTTMDIIRACPCPIWAVKPEPITREKIMLSIYFDPNREDHNAALNDELLRLADNFRTEATTEIHLVNVIELMNNELHQQNTKNLQQLAKKITTSKVKVVVNILEGSAKNALAHYAQEQSIALLVLGTRAEPGLQRFFIGSTAEKVLGKINCSILAVKPQSFINRVSLK